MGSAKGLAMQVRRVLETCLYVDDLDTAERFYHKVLGLEPFACLPGRHTFFRCDAGVFLLFNPAETEKPGQKVPSHGARGAGHVAFAIQAAELPDWRMQLHRAGVTIEAEITWPGGGQSLYLRDPAGNSVELATPQTWNMDKAEGLA